MALLQRVGLEIKKIFFHLLNKLKTIKGSEQAIVKGFTIGVAVSFTPFVGFHAIISIIIAKITRQNGTASVLGTLAGNPWTFPVIWYLTLHTGKFLLSGDFFFPTINFIKLFKELFHAVIMLDFDMFLSDIWPILFPMLIGCIPFCIVIWIFLPRLMLPILVGGINKGVNKNDKRTRV